MERGHGRDSCDTSNILFLDLDGGSNLRQFSHLYTQDLCTLYVTLYEKKFFLKIIHDFISHFFCPQSHDYVKAYPALTEPTGGKLILLGLCTAAVISHHADRGSSATNFLREAIPGAANLATLMDSLFHQSVLFLSQHISQAGTILFYTCVFAFGAQGLCLSGSLLYPQHPDACYLKLHLAYLPK